MANDTPLSRESSSSSIPGKAAGAPTASPTPFVAGAWELLSSGEGDGLAFTPGAGESAIVHVFCPAGGGLTVNVKAFRPIGSEERMSLGSGATVVALVADVKGDALRGGVSATGPVPGELRSVLEGASGVSVSYGAQSAGPLPPVPMQTAQNFVMGCND
ncbi:hypothetical protein [Aurantiacibacter arachoides]|nr:hypothetical protein [Aurantiacibacter arachoides]GGD44985.1 hypothetical protein GCM10011411_00770 [Aurantiacibacter arachoides]